MFGCIACPYAAWNSLTTAGVALYYGGKTLHESVSLCLLIFASCILAHPQLHHFTPFVASNRLRPLFLPPCFRTPADVYSPCSAAGRCKSVRCLRVHMPRLWPGWNCYVSVPCIAPFTSALVGSFMISASHSIVSRSTFLQLFDLSNCSVCQTIMFTLSDRSDCMWRRESLGASVCNHPCLHCWCICMQPPLPAL